MRHWVFHPLIFYPLIAVLAAVVIALSLRPQAWPRDPAPAAAQVADSALIYRGDALGTPDVEPQQNVYVPRNLLGQAQALRIALKPSQPAPIETEKGARILLTPADAARLEGRTVTVEVSYNPLPINVAAGLAVSVQGNGPTNWVHRPAAPEAGVLRYEIPAVSGVNAIGLRALSTGTDQAYGLEITRIRVTPHA